MGKSVWAVQSDRLHVSQIDLQIINPTMLNGAPRTLGFGPSANASAPMTTIEAAVAAIFHILTELADVAIGLADDFAPLRLPLPPDLFWVCASVGCLVFFLGCAA